MRYSLILIISLGIIVGNIILKNQKNFDNLSHLDASKKNPIEPKSPKPNAIWSLPKAKEFRANKVGPSVDDDDPKKVPAPQGNQNAGINSKNEKMPIINEMKNKSPIDAPRIFSSLYSHIFNLEQDCCHQKFEKLGKEIVPFISGGEFEHIIYNKAIGDGIEEAEPRFKIFYVTWVFSLCHTTPIQIKIWIGDEEGGSIQIRDSSLRTHIRSGLLKLPPNDLIMTYLKAPSLLVIPEENPSIKQYCQELILRPDRWLHQNDGAISLKNTVAGVLYCANKMKFKKIAVFTLRLIKGLSTTSEFNCLENP